MARNNRQQGRVTASKRAQQSAGAKDAPAPAPAESSRPAPSGRYTPATPAFRMRPRWHKFAGLFGVFLGVLIIVLNDAMFMVDTTLLPFGHNELYLMLGLVVAVASSWFLGLFDRGDTIYG